MIVLSKKLLEILNFKSIVENPDNTFDATYVSTRYYSIKIVEVINERKKIVFRAVPEYNRTEFVDFSVQYPDELDILDLESLSVARESTDRDLQETDVLPVHAGGTGRDYLNPNEIVVGNGYDPVKQVPAGVDGTVLVGRTGEAPEFEDEIVIDGDEF